MKDLQKEFVPYELALRMRELGFDYNILGFYYDNKLFEHCCGNTEVKDLEKGDVPAPTFSQAFRWFREKYNLHSVFEHDSDNYCYVIQGINDIDFATIDASEEGTVYETYEEAELACLEKLIEIC